MINEKKGPVCLILLEIIEELFVLFDFNMSCVTAMLLKIEVKNKDCM